MPDQTSKRRGDPSTGCHWAEAVLVEPALCDTNTGPAIVEHQPSAPSNTPGMAIRDIQIANLLLCYFMDA